MKEPVFCRCGNKEFIELDDGEAYKCKECGLIALK